MSIAATAPSAFRPWSEEPSARPDRRKIRARIGGLHCSLCTGTIEKALGLWSIGFGLFAHLPEPA